MSSKYAFSLVQFINKEKLKYTTLGKTERDASLWMPVQGHH